MARPSRKPVFKRRQSSQALVSRATQVGPRQETAQERDDRRQAEMLAVNNEYAALSESPFVQDTLGWNKGFFPRDVTGNMAVYRPSDDRIFVSRSTTPEPDTASVTPLASRKTARSAIAHEVGHAQDFRARKENREAFPEYARVTRPTFYAEHPDIFRFVPSQPFPVLTVLQDKDASFKKAPKYDTQNKTVTRVPSSGLRKMLGIRENQPMTASEQKAFADLDRYYALGGTKTNDFGKKFLMTDPDESLAQAYTNAVDFLSRTNADTSGYREMLGRYEGNTPGAGAVVQDLLRARPVYSKHPLKGVIR